MLFTSIMASKSVKHGAYIARFDRRSRAGRCLSQIESELVAALGGSPSPQQILILQRAAVKAVRCALLEKELIKQGGLSCFVEKHYLAFSRSLREDLRCLGLQRQERPVQELTEYVKEAYG